MESATALKTRPVTWRFITDKLQGLALVVLLVILAALGLKLYFTYQSYQLTVAGDEAIERGNAKLAENLFSRSLVLSPRSPEALYRLAVAHMMLGNLDASFESYREAQELGAGDGGALLNDLGLRNLNQGRDDKAVILFLGAVGENPVQPDYRLNLASVFRRQGKAVSERLEVEKARVLESGALRPLLRLGDLELRAGRVLEALAAARRATELYPGRPAAYEVYVRLAESKRRATW